MAPPDPGACTTATNGGTMWSDLTEPARIRAFALAVVQLCAALGIVLPFDLPGIAEAVIGVLAVVLPLVTGELIRSKVTPATSPDPNLRA